MRGQCCIVLAAVAFLAASGRAGETKPANAFARVWTHAGPTSALVYWQIDDIAKSAYSYVEYGETADYGRKTELTTRARWVHLHRLTGLATGKPCHYRMVLVDPATKAETKSPDATLTPAAIAAAVAFPAEGASPPYALDKADATYVLTKDIAAPGTAIEIKAPNITLELDGHTVTFAESSKEQVRGISIECKGPAVVRNGHIVQGAAGKDYSAAVESRRRAEKTEIFGITTDVHRPNAYPIKFFGKAAGLKIHHNHLFSRVTELESRHYPGNDLLRLDIAGSDIEVNDNLLTDGCHRGITMSVEKDAGDVRNLEVHHNDIQHHMMYTNGYAFMCHAPNLNIHHNKVTSTGRAVHLTAANTEFHDNYLDTRGHKELDDMPQKSRPFKERRIEVHGIKFEDAGAKNCKVYNNFMRSVQAQPDDKFDYVPPTPLNVACYDPNGMNEVYNNTFIGLTEYKKTRHGGYGDTGQWATGIYFVGMTHGPAKEGQYAIYIHNNKFISNDLFASAAYNAAPNMTIRIEKNTFTLATKPEPTEGRKNFLGLSKELEEAIQKNNTFEGTQP